MFGLIFLFKWTGEKDERPALDAANAPPGLFYAKQMVPNACATQAILSILLNADSAHLKRGSTLDELKAFASLPECPSGDGYMRSLYEWAAGNLASGDLEGAFNEVDADGSGEMEFEEFKLMLSA